MLGKWMGSDKLSEASWGDFFLKKKSKRDVKWDWKFILRVREKRGKDLKTDFFPPESGSLKIDRNRDGRQRGPVRKASDKKATHE